MNIRKALLIILITSVCVLALEVYFNIQFNLAQGQLNEQHGEYRTSGFLPSTHTEIIYTGNPNHLEHNRYGFRDNYYPKIKENGIFRIAIIGDSVTYGVGVSFEDTFSKRLEHSLNSNSDQKYEVLSFGVIGYNTVQQLALWREEIVEFSPDLVIWNYVLNDIASPIYHDTLGLGADFYSPKSKLLAKVESVLFAFNERIISTSKGCQSIDFHVFLYCVYDDKAEDQIQKIANTLKGTEVLLTITPILYSGDEKPFIDAYPYNAIHQNIADWARKADLNYIDFLDVFSQYPNSHVSMNTEGSDYLDIYHPSSEGHQLMANSLLNYLYSTLDYQPINEVHHQ